MERAPPPPPPAPPLLAPPPPPPPGTPGTPPELGRVLREALQRAGEALGEDGGIRELLRRRRDSFQGPLKWLLFHRPVPPLIQDGPQCGLVALSMAGALLGPPRPQLGLGALLDTARARGYTRHGEMFSAAQMAALAQELFPCRAELLQGGLGGPNRGRVLQHLLRGRPLLVPYDEDSNHAPCCRRGHKAHWALLNGVILAVPPQEPLGPRFRQDPEIPNVFHANFGEAASHLARPKGVQEGSVGAHGAGEGSRIGEGSHFGEESLAEECSQSEAVPDFGRGSGFEEGCRFGAGSQPEDGSHFDEGSQPKSLPDLGRGSRFGVGSQADSLPDLGWGSRFGSGSHFESGSQAEDGSHFGERSLTEKGSQTEEGSSRFEEGSQAEGMPDLGRESRFGEGSSFGGVGEGSQIEQMHDLGRGSQPEDGSHFGERSLFEGGGGSRPDSLPDFESGSRFGSGVLVLALQGKSPRPQLWALGELGASNGQLGELSPRRWGGGFVLPPGGVREGLQGRAVLLHPLPTPPQ